MKGLIKKATKHTKGHKKQQASLDFSTHSSEEGRGVRFPKDLDSFSQDSRNCSMSSRALPPAFRASLHQGAMSEPVKRSHRVQIKDSLEKRRGILRISTSSNPWEATAHCIKEGSTDLENSSQSSSQVDSPRIQTRCPEPGLQPRTPPSQRSHQDSPGSDQVFEWPEPAQTEEFKDGEQTEQPWDSTGTMSVSAVLEVLSRPEPEPQPPSLPQVQPQSQPQVQPHHLVPPHVCVCVGGGGGGGGGS